MDYRLLFQMRMSIYQLLQEFVVLIVICGHNFIFSFCSFSFFTCLFVFFVCVGQQTLKWLIHPSNQDLTYRNFFDKLVWKLLWELHLLFLWWGLRWQSSNETQPYLFGSITQYFGNSFHIVDNKTNPFCCCL